ncbi:MAG: ABC transporter ATP-binding protein, partial [Ruminococcaceae bacterium]|nr:ABC transporter ATP-binding protein [Oscillospiraceae bacterium]
MNPNMSKGKTFGRVIKMLFEFYPVMVPVTLACILIVSVSAAVPDVFIQRVIAIIEKWYASGDWNGAFGEILPEIVVLTIVYVVSLIAVVLYTQLLAYITQGFLSKCRKKMFGGMQNLPIKYFDTHKHGDIMSHYTNDIDTLRQLISQALPSMLRALVVVISVLGIMLYYSIWMTLVLMIGVALMVYMTKKIGGGSAKYFIKQQQSLGKTEGFVQEMMNGQKVIKVFCHEKECLSDFDDINSQLCSDSFKAHAYANILGPVIQNIGNILYVIMAMAGGIFLVSNAKNFSLSGMAFSISIVVPFLNMTKQFTGNVNQLSQQINAIVMGLAGADRLFALMDEEPEADEGYVTLVNATEDKEGNIIETGKHTGRWAWKHPHGDGSVTYTPLMGNVTLNEVDFGYEEGKIVL